MNNWGFAAFLGLMAGCSDLGGYRDTSVQMKSVETLDIASYQGRWFEIARFPNRFEKDCVGVTADYALREDGRVSVTNTCRKGTLDGPVKVAQGVARVLAPGQLKVKFVRWLPFEGDYWVLGLVSADTVSIVGAPSGDYGWILARTPQIDAADLEAAFSVLRSNGYDAGRIEMIAQ